MDAGRFAGELRARGLRVTEERLAILAEVLARRGHFDPEGLHMEMRRKGLRVSKASVYRTIPLLLELGVIERVEHTSSGHAHYELRTAGAHHDHMLCTSCGRVIEFFSEDLERLQEAVCRSKGFAGATHTLEIRGLCRECGGVA
jgi:Fur family ferric uptake transcriptional regulator